MRHQACPEHWSGKRCLTELSLSTLLIGEYLKHAAPCRVPMSLGRNSHQSELHDRGTYASGVGCRVVRGPDWKWGKQVHYGHLNTYCFLIFVTNFMHLM